MELHLQKFIRANENWEELLTASPYNLKIGRADGYIIFKYSMIESDLSEPIVQECRGIILQEYDFEVVCRPFDKFFNVQESLAAEIDWDTAFITEKLDGSLIKVWYHNFIWHVSTNGTIDARDAEIASVNYIGRNFFELFNHAVVMQDMDTGILDKENTYLFELCSPFNKVVVYYGQTQVFHIATRNTLTGEYLDEEIGIEKPAVFSLSSLDECLELVEDFPFDEEGYVVRDDKGRMVKIKSPAYVAAHRLVNNGVVTPRRILGIVERDGQDDFLSLFPEYTEAFEEVIERFNSIRGEETEIIETLNSREFESRKALAQYAFETSLPNFVFAYVDGHAKSFKEWFFGLPINSRAKMIGY